MMMWKDQGERPEEVGDSFTAKENKNRWAQEAGWGKSSYKPQYKTFKLTKWNSSMEVSGLSRWC